MCQNLSQIGLLVYKLQSFQAIGIIVCHSVGYPGSIPGRVIQKTQTSDLMPPCLTLSIIRYVSRVKWSNLGNGVAPSPTP